MFDRNQTFMVDWALSTGHLPLCQYSFMATTAMGLGMTGSVPTTDRGRSLLVTWGLSPTDRGGSLLVSWGCRPQRWHLLLAILVCGVSATEVTSATCYSGVWSVGHRGDICDWLFWCVEHQPQKWHQQLVCGVCHRDTCECLPQRCLLLVCGVSATEIPATGVWSVSHRADVCG